MENPIAKEDVNFAQLSVKLNFASTEHVRKSVALFRRYEGQGGELPSIPRIMVNKGYMRREHAVQLLNHILGDHPKPQPYIPQSVVASDIMAPPSGAEAAAPVEVTVEEPEGFADFNFADSDPGDLADSDPDKDEEAEMLAGLGATVFRGEVKGYKILEVIGEGSMGIVYRAHQISMDRIVALKILPEGKTKDSKFVEEFLTEARNAGRLNHPNLIRVHEVGRTGNTYFYSMEYVDGLTLGEMSDEFEGGRLDPKRAVNIFIQIAAALDHGYRSEIVHREIRPDCIMITEGDQAKLEGLGLTKDEDKRYLKGQNAYYVAPEQCRGDEVDSRTDLYSLGCCLFHCLTGEAPFQGGKQKDIFGRRLIMDPPMITELNADLPSDLADVTKRLMARDPLDRFQTPQEALDALKQVSFSGPVSVNNTGARGRVAGRPSSRLRRTRGSGRGGGRVRRRRRFRK